MRRKLENRGSVVLAGAVALSSAGLLLTDGVLLMLGLGAALGLGMAVIISAWNLRRLELGMEAPALVRAGEPFRIKLYIKNRRKVFDAVGVVFIIKGPGGMEGLCHVPWVGTRSEAKGDVQMTATGRGYGRSLSCTFRSSVPLGLVTSEVERIIPHQITVFPRPVIPVELLKGGYQNEADPNLDRVHQESSGIPRGMREFRAGDRPYDVAWAASVRSSARGGGLIVKEWDPPGQRPRHATVLFHSHGADKELIRPDRFERALSLAWGCVGHLQALGVEVRWIADFEEWIPRNISKRSHLGELGGALASCKRSPGTERHELEARLEENRGELWVISDMLPNSWMGSIEERPAMQIVDVSRFEQGRKLRLGRGDHA